MFIKNFHHLATTPERKIVLELVETALESIQPAEVFKNNIVRHGNVLRIVDHEYNLDEFNRVFVLGFGKGSAGNTKLLENLIEDKITDGWVIDTEGEKFKKIEFTKGTHPLPSEANYKFTKKIISNLSGLTKKDLVLIVICGGGSAMLVAPHAITLKQKIDVGRALLKSGANIKEMNIVRNHLSDVKGGGLAGILYPAKVATLIYSDAPGNDLSTIASGPTVHDGSTIEDAKHIIKKYGIEKEIKIPEKAFVEKPKERKFFNNISNILVLSNETALLAMQKRAKELGHKAEIFSDRFQSDAKEAAHKLIRDTHPSTILLVGGETTVHVGKKAGKGGRNQEVVLGALDRVGHDMTICSFDSDGWDNSENAGAIGDYKTVDKAQSLGIKPEGFLDTNSSFDFFEKTGDALDTGRLPSNVSDLIIILRK